MLKFLLSQLVGIGLFASFNYGIYSYVRYRGAQLKKEEGESNWIQVLTLKKATLIILIFFLFGLILSLQTILQYYNIDYHLWPTMILFYFYDLVGSVNTQILIA